MRHSQTEKMEVIRLVEESSLSIRRTLTEFGIARSTFYKWYNRYCEDGYDGLADRKPAPRKFTEQDSADSKGAGGGDRP